MASVTAPSGRTWEVFRVFFETPSSNLGAVAHESMRCYRLRRPLLRPMTAKMKAQERAEATNLVPWQLRLLWQLLIWLSGLWPNRMWTVEAIDEGPSREVLRWRVRGWRATSELLADIRRAIEEAEPFPPGWERIALPPLYRR